MSWLLMFLTIAVTFGLLRFGGSVEPYRLKPVLDETGELRGPKRFHQPYPMTLKDILWLLLLLILYSAVAFYGLGDKEAPESWREFNVAGEGTVIMLETEGEIGRIQYYSAADTGNFRLESSTDREHWKMLGNLEQDYASVLRWNEFIPETPVTAQYLRISADRGGLHLGEVAVRDTEGRLLPATGFQLCDEQELVPERQSFMNGSYFDEIYHVRTAWEHIENVKPYEISHPPLGKIIIGLGIRLFGMNPFGWRFMGVLIGILMLPIFYLFLKNLTGSTLASACTTFVFAFDFMHFVQTRIATIDSYSAFFILLMYYFFYRYYVQPWNTPFRKTLLPLGLSGLCFGLGVASKWTVVFGGAGLALLWCLRQGQRLGWAKWNGVKREWLRYLLPTVLMSCVFFLLVPALCCLLAYIPYGTAEGVSLLSRDYLNIILENVKYMFTYHSGLTATHPYQSSWWQWIFDVRPILYYLEYAEDEVTRISSFGAFGNPLFWWTGLGAVVCLAVKAIRGDRLAALPVLGWLSCLVPWIIVPRCAFVYHYFPCTLFLALAIGMLGAELLEDDRVRGRRWFAVLTVGSLLLFVIFYPTLSGMRVPGWYYGSKITRWFAGMWPF